MKKFFLFALISVCLFGCDSDIDLTAPYEDITVVYGLLDQTSDVQYIRINKSFLGDAALADMASVRDSVEYQDGDILSARLEKISNDNLVESWELEVDSVQATNETIFYVPGETNDYRRVYTLDETLEQGTNIEYKLVIEFSDPNKETVTASTKLISNSLGAIINPMSNTALSNNEEIRFFDPPSDEGIRPERNLSARWRSEVGAKRYALFLEMDYVEKTWSNPVPVAGNGDFGTEVSSEVKTMRWYMGETFTTNVAETASQSENLEKLVSGSLFINEVVRQIEPDPFKTREIGIFKPELGANHYSVFRFILAAADEDFSSFLDFTEPSTSLAQERPTWTNVTNGQGLFSSRLEQVSTDIRTNIHTLEELCTGLNTSELNFCWRGASTQNCDVNPDPCTCFYLCE